ncbi:hypothetical protein SELMODRAFT_424159 [Selaginella moellendorffii]|uniref:Uncharacterized protein n=1 Tax=Selaginella moellendorffii TaxID=88036 RepID=D8SP06_SELML|nr:hypothetical protein SELMODRAFT_424159 [Selaginella moellendorffii]
MSETEALLLMLSNGDIILCVPIKNQLSLRNQTLQLLHGYNKLNGNFKEMETTRNDWEPYVEQTSEFSLAQLWITSNKLGPVNTIEAGWQNDTLEVTMIKKLEQDTQRLIWEVENFHPRDMALAVPEKCKAHSRVMDDTLVTGSLEDAKIFFNGMSDKNLIWTTMITAYIPTRASVPWISREETVAAMGWNDARQDHNAASTSGASARLSRSLEIATPIFAVEHGSRADAGSVYHGSPILLEIIGPLGANSPIVFLLSDSVDNSHWKTSLCCSQSLHSSSGAATTFQRQEKSETLDTGEVVLFNPFTVLSMLEDRRRLRCMLGSLCFIRRLLQTSPNDKKTTELCTIVTKNRDSTTISMFLSLADFPFFYFNGGCVDYLSISSTLHFVGAMDLEGNVSFYFATALAYTFVQVE